MAKKSAQKIMAYKAFDKNLKCRDFQFAVGETYKYDGEVKACYAGFHACTNPFDVWSYYDLINSRFAVVELSGAIDKHDVDSKIAAAEITIKAELTLPDFIKRGVSALIDAVKVATEKDEKVQAASGDSSQLAASGNSSQLAASGNYSKLAASGNSSKLAASGYCSKLAASGYCSQLAASGDTSQLAASGDTSQLAASGHYSQLAASGHYSQLAASGDSSQLGASGHYSHLAASGHYSHLAASGYCSKLAASGNSSKLAASGENSVIASSAVKATAKGALGTWISLAEFDSNGKCVGFATGCIGQDGLEPDTYYRAAGGKLVAA